MPKTTAEQGIVITPSNQVYLDLTGAKPGEVLVAVLEDETRLCLFVEEKHKGLRVVPELAPPSVLELARKAARSSLGG